MAHDLDYDLEIRTNTERWAGGRWINGTVDGHRINALVFPEHAESELYEIGRSRISKLWLQKDGMTVFNWDRGMDIEAKTPTAAAIVDFLCDGLADLIFP